MVDGSSRYLTDIDQIANDGAYAVTVRRRLIDIAGKIVSHIGKIVLKISSACFESLRLPKLIKRCRQVPALE